MKTTLAAILIFTSLNSFADFSGRIIGKEEVIQDKDFSQHNKERLHTGFNEIILTFDDGPTPGVTELVLDVLKANNVKATFFVIAEKAKASPALMKRIVNEGHIVANHSYSHLPLADLSFLKWKKIVNREVLDAHTILAPYMTNSQKFYYRAPEGKWDDKYARQLNTSSVGRKYIGPLLWDIGGELIPANGSYSHAADWACWSKSVSVDDCLTGYINETNRMKGGVVLMHDLRKSSALMLAKYIPLMEQAGYVFKTLDDVNWSK